MQRQDLVDSVNVHRREFQHHKQAGTVIGLQETLDEPRHGESWWVRIKQRWFKWEHNLIVAGRTIEKGWVMPQQLGIALIITMLSCTGVLYWRVIDKQAAQDQVWGDKFEKQNEMLIRLDERLKSKNENDNRQFQELKQDLQSNKDHMAAVETVVNTKIAELKAKVK